MHTCVSVTHTHTLTWLQLGPWGYGSGPGPGLWETVQWLAPLQSSERSDEGLASENADQADRLGPGP